VCSAPILIAMRIRTHIEAKAYICDIFNDFRLISWGESMRCPAVSGPFVEGPHLQ